MAIGGVTAFGLPQGLPLWVDAAVMAAGERIVLGGGSRSWKVLAPPSILLTLPGVPPAGSGRDSSLEIMPGEAPGEAALLAMLAKFADIARGFIAFGDAEATFQRGKQAAAVGASATADRWYDDALEKIAALHSEAWPRTVIILPRESLR
jgi:hypothetical protein